jgi:hypothetical protein
VVRVSDQCSQTSCNAYLLLPLKHGALEVLTDSLPEGSEVFLAMHRQTLLSDLWWQVDRSAQLPAAELEVPISGWYRLRFLVPLAPGSWLHTCYQWVPHPAGERR